MNPDSLPLQILSGLLLFAVGFLFGIALLGWAAGGLG